MTTTVVTVLLVALVVGSPALSMAQEGAQKSKAPSQTEATKPKATKSQDKSGSDKNAAEHDRAVRKVEGAAPPIVGQAIGSFQTAEDTSKPAPAPSRPDAAAAASTGTSKPTSGTSNTSATTATSVKKSGK